MKTALMTAAIGRPKIAPAMPATFEPIRTLAKTMIGGIPTASAIRRGWTMFMITNQPIAIPMSAPTVASGTLTNATRTGGTHATNGPKKGIAMRTPAVAAITGTYGSPSATLTTKATIA